MTAQTVRDAEHEADAVRRSLLTQLREAFTTPLEPEDLYELSERLDAVLNGAKNAIREAEVMGTAPDEAMATMAAELADGVGHLVAAFQSLSGDHEQATAQADKAIDVQRRLERSYRAAMSSLVETKEPRELGSRRELYRRYARLGDEIVRVAERVWYTVVKET